MNLTQDNIIKCPLTNTNLCYVTKVNEDITNYISMACGFWTNSLMKEGDKFYEEQMERLPELYKDIAWKDPETGLVWIPNMLNIENVGMIYAEGTSDDDWMWAVVPFVEMDKKEQEILNEKYKADNSKKTYFNQDEYISALMELGIIPKPK